MITTFRQTLSFPASSMILTSTMCLPSVSLDKSNVPSAPIVTLDDPTVAVDSFKPHGVENTNRILPSPPTIGAVRPAGLIVGFSVQAGGGVTTAGVGDWEVAMTA
jgi:hypothetical protein